MSFGFGWNCIKAHPDDLGWCMASKYVTRLLPCVVVMLLSAIVAVTTGSRHLDLQRALQGGSPDREILMELRLPRALLALWTGGGLAVAGVLFQALLRNSLASPYTLGVSGGAS